MKKVKKEDTIELIKSFAELTAYVMGMLLAVVVIIAIFSADAALFILKAGIILYIGFIAFTIILSVSTAIQYGKLSEYNKLNLVEYKEGTLIINEISDKNAKYLKVKKHVAESRGYIPQKTHIGAVTSNGVMAGGTYTTGGYNKSSYYVVNDRAHIIYTGNGGSDEFVNKIRFSEELLEKVKKSVIGKYLNDDNEIELMRKADFSMTNITAKNFGFGSNEAYNVLQRDLINTLPSAKMCNQIRNYICML